MAQAMPNLIDGTRDFAQQQGPHMPIPNQHLPQWGNQQAFGNNGTSPMQAPMSMTLPLELGPMGSIDSAKIFGINMAKQ